MLGVRQNIAVGLLAPAPAIAILPDRHDCRSKCGGGTLSASNLDIFVRQVKNRSEEHRRAMKVLSEAGIAGQMVAILRQELDSMVRVIYLLTQSLEQRELLFESSISGERWTEKTKRGKDAIVTDAQMVELSQKLFGWTQYVYKFGCAFIHLSNLHDYKNRDPLSAISDQERQDIFNYCRQYHSGPEVGKDNFIDLIPFIPNILEKVSGNLACYLEDLEEGQVKEPRDV